MTLVFYERLGHEGRRPSPFSWRIRYALAHKRLEPEVVPVPMAEEKRIIQLSGQKFVPVLVHGPRIVPDSWAIACYLEDAFPDRPPLFDGEHNRIITRFFSRWVDETLHPLIRALVLPQFLDCLDERDRKYYRESREALLGRRLEDFAADREENRTRLRDALKPLRETLAEWSFLGGTEPRYADYLAFAAFQWARLGSPEEMLGDEPTLAAWRDRMVRLFGDLGDRFPLHPDASRSRSVASS